jgi:hypothetical protein
MLLDLWKISSGCGKLCGKPVGNLGIDAKQVLTISN